MIRNRRRQIEDVPEAEILRQLESDGVLSRSRYSIILRNWLEVFPVEQLRIEFFESIASEPKALLTRVLTHLGADPAVMPWDQVPLREVLNANAGRDIPEKYRARLRELLADEFVALRQVVPRPEVLSWRH